MDEEKSTGERSTESIKNKILMLEDKPCLSIRDLMELGKLRVQLEICEVKA